MRKIVVLILVFLLSAMSWLNISASASTQSESDQKPKVGFLGPTDPLKFQKKVEEVFIPWIELKIEGEDPHPWEFAFTTEELQKLKVKLEEFLEMKLKKGDLEAACQEEAEKVAAKYPNSMVFQCRLFFWKIDFQNPEHGLIKSNAINDLDYDYIHASLYFFDGTYLGTITADSIEFNDGVDTSGGNWIFDSGFALSKFYPAGRFFRPALHTSVIFPPGSNDFFGDPLIKVYGKCIADTESGGSYVFRPEYIQEIFKFVFVKYPLLEYGNYYREIEMGTQIRVAYRWHAGAGKMWPKPAEIYLSQPDNKTSRVQFAE